ncbi:NADPH-dependent ferric siderophore reductase [Roseiarcus fermentans]|uniref:NADPH-dependent ferric siderophore reductase n=1 Tax=Roseiarcus fermentans TaxID=1473586 RepID=A0A366ERX3_9HYPH|nr:siderophore-interacting protein [Roseiarcus fermentans]RBP05157.1 NADPH-dependent ferric siderophore reductase [Roseiarcus fermentans]
MTDLATARHAIERLRREPRRRRLTVESVAALTPKMRRIVFTAPELADFASLGADDHIKVFAPDPSAPQGAAMRDYTPRAFDPVRCALTIDFALHEAGPASDWARGAMPGDSLEIGGPRGSMVVADDFDAYLLVGDETALPAIGRRVEGLRAGVPVTTIVLVDGPEEIQTFETRADWRPVWLFRSGSDRDDAALLSEALARWPTPPGDGYVWIAAEARAARALKTAMLEDRGHPKAWLKAAGYWVRGKAGESEKLDS